MRMHIGTPRKMEPKHLHCRTRSHGLAIHLVDMGPSPVRLGPAHTNHGSFILVDLHSPLFCPAYGPSENILALDRMFVAVLLPLVSTGICCFHIDPAYLEVIVDVFERSWGPVPPLHVLPRGL